MNNKHHCGRLGKHLAHYWRGGAKWDPKMVRFVRHTYFCTGWVQVEGGHHEC